MKTIIVFLAFLVLMQECSAHGRIVTPLPRGSLWRDPEKRYNNTVINYNDIENNCGGFHNQFTINGGKCGLCGDPWQDDPRDHESAGIYDSGIIPDENHFERGQEFTISLLIDAAHGGFAVFQLCPFTSGTEKTDVTEECFANHQITLKGDNVTQDHVRYLLHKSKTGPFYLSGAIPEDFPEGTRALLRWKWKAGNSWGRDENGQEGMGRGAQEHFFSCADLYIDTKLHPNINCLTRSQVTGQFIELENSVCSNYCPFGQSCRHMVSSGHCSLGCLSSHGPETCAAASRYGDWCVEECAGNPEHCSSLVHQRVCAQVCLDG